MPTARSRTTISVPVRWSSWMLVNSTRMGGSSLPLWKVEAAPGEWDRHSPQHRSHGRCSSCGGLTALTGLHHDGYLADAVTATADDEQRLEGVAEIVVRKVASERAQQWIAYRSKSRRRISDGHAGPTAQRAREKSHRGPSQGGVRWRHAAWSETTADDHVEIGFIEMA